jgi:hypothetical protein
MNSTGESSGWLRRAGVLAAAVASITVLAAACGGGGIAPVLAGTSNYQKALAYAQCMRAHGEPSYPDPTSNGGFVIDGKKDHLNGALMSSANKTCQHLLPKFAPMTATQQRQATTEALRYVACMRTHGIPNMPDPVVNAQGIQFRIGGAKGKGPLPGSQVLHNAMLACQKLLPGGAP